jgi:hypothetical protein
MSSKKRKQELNKNTFDLAGTGGNYDRFVVPNEYLLFRKVENFKLLFNICFSSTLDSFVRNIENFIDKGKSLKLKRMSLFLFSI